MITLRNKKFLALSNTSSDAQRDPPSAALLVCAALPWLIADAHGVWKDQVGLWIASSGLCSAAFVVSGLLGAGRRGAGRHIASAAVIGTLGLATPILVTSPMFGLLGLVGATFVLSLLHRDLLLPAPRPSERHVPSAGLSVRAATLMAVLLWFLIDVVPPTSAVVRLCSMAWMLLVPLSAALCWVYARRKSHPLRSAVIFGLSLLECVLVVTTWAHPSLAISLGMLVTGVMAWAAKPIRVDSELESTLLDTWLGHPARFLVSTFALLCALGTILLSLPQCAASGRSIALFDAFFTSVSAVCVTGLIVLDTPVSFSVFGQCAILLLIQIGGLGIMSFSTVGAWMFGRRLSMRHENTAASLLSAYDRRHLFTAARTVLIFTFCVEAVGALLLTFAFLNLGESWTSALYRGVFTAISAFCNAGFALQSESLVPYQQSPLILHVVAGLIILGGMSPFAALSLPQLVIRRKAVRSAEMRLALLTTCLLLLVGFGLTLALEWRGTLSHLPAEHRLHNAWFQSVTMRTAGFNSVDFSHLQSATVTVFMVLMFIGGSPGGTAGGIKTTTFGMLWLAVTQRMVGRTFVSVAGRRVSRKSLEQALLVVVVAALSFFGFLLAVQITQPLGFQEAMFEVISALGTVGVSLGATTKLDGIGKIIIALAMFVGRVGGLSVLLLLVNREERVATIDYPEEDVTVG